ncbi:MAG: hypothetical protein MUC60_19025 [Oscillatoria sp. Prado101]|nr:hypothetical protein [Oscillatoria sp. Prado101]
MAREAQHISDPASPGYFENLVELVAQHGWPDQRPLRLFGGALDGSAWLGRQPDQLVRLEAKIDSADRLS